MKPPESERDVTIAWPECSRPVFIVPYSRLGLPCPSGPSSPFSPAARMDCGADPHRSRNRTAPHYGRSIAGVVCLEHLCAERERTSRWRPRWVSRRPPFTVPLPGDSMDVGSTRWERAIHANRITLRYDWLADDFLDAAIHDLTAADITLSSSSTIGKKPSSATLLPAQPRRGARRPVAVCPEPGVWILRCSTHGLGRRPNQ